MREGETDLEDYSASILKDSSLSSVFKKIPYSKWGKYTKQVKCEEETRLGL